MFFKNNKSLLGRTRKLEAQIDEFLDKVNQCGKAFSAAFEIYLEKGVVDDFDRYMSEVQTIEREADDLRRNIEVELYRRTLIPDLRGDVLQLLENIDDLTNIYKADLFRISVQQPDILEAFRPDFLQLARTAVACVDSLVAAARSFFTDIDAVRDKIREVVRLESDADQISSPLQRKIFSSDLDLAHKTNLRYFVERIDELANQAEDVADQLAIYAIKRRI